MVKKEVKRMHDALEVIGYVGGVAGLVAVAWAFGVGAAGLVGLIVEAME